MARPVTPSRPHHVHRIGLIGSGALGQLIRERLEARAIPTAELVSVFSLDEGSLEHVLENCDIVVEAAGQTALKTHGPSIVARGKTLVALSNGALADDEMARLLTSGPAALPRRSSEDPRVVTQPRADRTCTTARRALAPAAGVTATR